MNKEKKKDLTIIIVAYKSAHIIGQALTNIVGKGYRIIIIDNGSNDNLEVFLKENYSHLEIELILLENNCGFGRANNLALEKVTTKYALIQNPDAVITEKSIDNLLKEAKKDRKVALASPFPVANENFSKSQQQNFINDYKNKIKILDETKKHVETTFICGGYVLMNIDVFRKIGFFDDNLFLYGEDEELSQRSIANGYKNILVKNAFVFHYGQGSTEIHGIFAKYKMLYFRQWHQGWAKAYLRRKKDNYLKIWLKTIIQFLSVSLYIVILDKRHIIIRLARSLGSASNLLGIDCFNKTNKIVKIKKINV